MAQPPQKEFKVIRSLTLKTSSARKWEEFNWFGDRLIFVQNDTHDLQIMIDHKSSDEDIIDIPNISFGGQQISINFGTDIFTGEKHFFSTVWLNHSAVADGTIKIILGGASSIYSMAAGGAIIIDGYQNDDYVEIDFTTIQVAYAVGTQANAAVTITPPRWAARNYAKRMRLLADQDVYIRYDHTSGVQHFYYANTYYIIRKRWENIYVTRVAIDGTLRVWIEG